MEGWRLFTDGCYIKFVHKCGAEFNVSDNVDEELIDPVIIHVC